MAQTSLLGHEVTPGREGSSHAKLTLSSFTVLPAGSGLCVHDYFKYIQGIR